MPPIMCVRMVKGGLTIYQSPVMQLSTKTTNLVIILVAALDGVVARLVVITTCERAKTDRFDIYGVPFLCEAKGIVQPDEFCKQEFDD